MGVTEAKKILIRIERDRTTTRFIQVNRRMKNGIGEVLAVYNSRKFSLLEARNSFERFYSGEVFQYETIKN